MRYGIIGNCKTAALIHESGRIDWCCLPNFDSPSAFAALLDQNGGHFGISLAGECRTTQNYLPNTNILETIFDDGENAFALVDFMPRYRKGSAYAHPVEIHRLLRPLRGSPSVRISFVPRLNYARGETAVTLEPSFVGVKNSVEDIYLYSSLPLKEVMNSGSIPLTKEEFLLLTYNERIDPPDLALCHDRFEKTKDYWETWSGHCRLPKVAPEAVLRSALTLKLMTYDDTGAIIAAPTTSLPEIVGKGRNWDYRYCWLRDASLMLEALKSIGHFEEAKAFIHFLLRLFESRQTKIQILYRIDGGTNLEEKILTHLSGYMNSGPVRIGNQACHTKQNDIYGEVLNTLYLYFFHYRFEKMTDDVWALVKFLANTTMREWKTPDAGIWEFRNRLADFTFSKVLCWVALDRAIKIAERLHKTGVIPAWRKVADEIRRDVFQNGWMDPPGAFTQTYGSLDLDVSTLQMCRYGFLDSNDPRWIATVEHSAKALIRNGYGFRYASADDFGKPESGFILATLWIAKALFTIGRKDEAFRLFEKTLASANHLGLLSEDVDPATGALLGNFPQAYSHMAVINTANLLSRG